MRRRRIVTGLTIVFAGLSLTLVVVGLVVSPAVLILAAVFAGVAAIMYYQASGRLARRVYQRVERRAAVDGGARAGRGGFGAGPRQEWQRPRGGRVGGRESEGVHARNTSRRADFEALGLEPGADQKAIREAYRDRIKEVHPDTEGGDEAAFRRVRSAYERLSE
ncbi:MAG: J domain-containing protein [Salinirussus sp.]